RSAVFFRPSVLASAARGASATVVNTKALASAPANNRFTIVFASIVRSMIAALRSGPRRDRGGGSTRDHAVESIVAYLPRCVSPHSLERQIDRCAEAADALRGVYSGVRT